MTEVTGFCPWGTRALRDAAWSVLVHGGAGDGRAGPAAERGCSVAARAGADVLRAGGSALEAVEQAVKRLEDDPLFNAGTGATLNDAELIELDAAIMEGRSLRFGGVCALPPFRNPIAIARAALEEEQHVLYAGPGAASFARAAGFVGVSAEELTTERARQALETFRVTRNATSGGTVGAVARDISGGCAAATSTGGVVGKRPGRVGDSPIPGCGTYADEFGAASATGQGELILRACLTKRAVDWLGEEPTVEAAATRAIAWIAGRLSARVGIILVDSRGRLGVARSSRCMPWAASCSEVPEVASGL